MMMIKGGKQGNRVSLSYQVGINQCKLQAVSLLGVVVVVLSVIERQRSAASLTSGIVSCHRLCVLVGSDLACTLGRLVDWWCLPVAVSRRWGLEFRRTVVRAAVHVLHRVSLLWRVCRVLLVIGVVVLRERRSSVPATRDEPAVVGERLQTLADSALGVEVGAEE